MGWILTCNCGHSLFYLNLIWRSLRIWGYKYNPHFSCGHHLKMAFCLSYSILPLFWPQVSRRFFFELFPAQLCHWLGKCTTLEQYSAGSALKETCMSSLEQRNSLFVNQFQFLFSRSVLLSWHYCGPYGTRHLVNSCTVVAFPLFFQNRFRCQPFFSG